MKKAIFCIILALVLLVGATTIVSARSERMYVSGNRVNERTEPSLNGEVIEQHNKGKDLEVVDDDGEWAQLDNGNYVSMDYLVPEENAEELFDNLPMYVLGDHVRERAEPNTDSLIMGEHSAGDLVIVTARHGDWYELTNGNYIRGDLLSADFQDIVPHYLESYKDLIVVSISNQKVDYWYYDEIIATGSCVTGHANNSPTPTGLYAIESKNTNFDMNGNPNNHVQYASFFNGGIAFHDASWRTHFGGDIYKTNGSHGCVNMKLDMAQFIYEHSRKGYTYVLVLP
ncbi:L,D-transpeptidase family protein [Candidatus Saccharibacteria bacterium]|nr:L,D-transpeptidase family protein [Candidatus Saccharibacteria bacterium]